MATPADKPADIVWVVVRLLKGSNSPEDASLHTGFLEANPAYLLCDILNEKNRDERYEFRVLEMPRMRVLRQKDAS